MLYFRINARPSLPSSLPLSLPPSLLYLQQVELIDVAHGALNDRVDLLIDNEALRELGREGVREEGEERW